MYNEAGVEKILAAPATRLTLFVESTAAPGQNPEFHQVMPETVPQVVRSIRAW